MTFSTHRRLAGAAPGLLAVAAFSLAASSPAVGRAAVTHKPIAVLRAGQSSNWFGYNQGILEKGTPFTSIAGDWTVPTASLHGAATNQASSTWIGIGGGCLDTACTATDATLIQAGTEQDANSDGSTTYYAWWEVIPAPGLEVTSVTVRPGDRIHVSIATLAPEVWTITLSDSNGQGFSQTVPYPSTLATAEWIEETPTLIGTSPGVASLPTLSTVPFDNAQVNGAPANLNPSEQIDLVDANGAVIGTPSAPDSERDGFNDCAWATSCAAPTTS
jgi:Peptidase A4 family